MVEGNFGQPLPDDGRVIPFHALYNNNKKVIMNSTRIICILLIVAGLMGMAFGGFSFTKETHKASLGPINLSVAEEKSVNIPLWASIAAIVAGAAVLVAGSKR
jgi:hypothetical protein